MKGRQHRFEHRQALQKKNLEELKEARKQIQVYLNELIAIPDDLVKKFNEHCQCNY